MMAPWHPDRYFFWLVTCLVLVVAAEEGAKTDDPLGVEEPSLKEITTTKEDVYQTDQTEPPDDKPIKLPKSHNKKAPPQNATWPEEIKNSVLHREGIPAVKPSPKFLKNTIIKGRNLNESQLSSHNSLNETTTGAPKFRRKKRPNRVQSATEMSLPSTSAAWALASLITTPREKLVPLHGPVKPFIQWSTILVGSSTTESTPQGLSTEIEEPITTVSSSVVLQLDRSSQNVTESPDPLPTPKPPASTFRVSPSTRSQVSKTTVPTSLEPKISKQKVIKVTKESDVTIRPLMAATTTIKNAETTSDEKSKSEKPTTTTELDNAINKSDGGKKSNILQQSGPDEWGNAVSHPDPTGQTTPVTPGPSKITTLAASSLPTSTAQSIISSSKSSTTKGTTSPKPTTIPATTDVTNPATPSSRLPPVIPTLSNDAEVPQQLDENSLKNITLNLITPLPTTPQIPTKLENSSKKEDIFSPTNFINGSNTIDSRPSEVTTNFSKIDFVINFENTTTRSVAENTTTSAIENSISSTTVKTLTTVNTSSVLPDVYSFTTTQSKEYNEVFPFSENFKETSEKTPHGTGHASLSTTEYPPPNTNKEHENLTSTIHENYNVIETPEIFEEGHKSINFTKEGTNILNNTGNPEIIVETVTAPPSVENTPKVIGTLYTVNKTVHFTTKEPKGTYENGLLNFNDTFSQHPKLDESDDISEDLDERLLETIKSSNNFSKIPEEVEVSTTAAPPVIVSPSTKIRHSSVPSSTTPKEGTTDDGIGDQDIYDLDTTMITRLLIQASVITVCQHIEELRSSILKLLQTDNRDLDRKQIVINAPDTHACMAGISPREDNLVPVEIFMTDKNGESDNTLTNSFIKLWQKVGLDFPYPVKKVEKFIGQGKWKRYGERETNSTMAAIVISVTAGVCLLLITILLIIIKKRHKGFSYGQRCTPVSLEDYSLDNISVYNSVRRKGVRSSKRSYGNPAFDDPSAISHVLNFATLSSYCNNRANIDEEFSQVPVVSVKPDELPPGVDGKNRFANVIPIPETRVPLPESKPGSDKDTYINANFVKGAKGEEKFYIACQAPLKETVSDFWRMIWHHQCRLIIMLTELQEGGVEKCADYLPPSEVLDCHRVFNGLQVTLKKREVQEKYIISSLQLKNLENNLWREVVHLWYVAWPHQGVPDEVSSIIALLIEARSYIKSKENSSPVVIHCCPGTGRTGTIIAIDICIRDFEIKRTIDVPKTVYNIRKDRAGAVQTKDQYAFIYQVLHLYATKLTGGGLDSI